MKPMVIETPNAVNEAPVRKARVRKDKVETVTMTVPAVSGRKVKVTAPVLKVVDVVVSTGKTHRKAKAVIVVPVKKVYPIQIRHLASPVQPKGKKALVGSDTKTLCGRVVVKQMTRVAYPLSGRTVAECPECSSNSHENNAFEIVRSAANKAK